MKYTQNQIEKTIKEKTIDTVEIIDNSYKNTDTNMRLHCKTCNHIWDITPRSYLQNQTICPNCNTGRSGKLSQNEVSRRIKSVLGEEYELQGLYTGKRNKISIKHSCGHSYYVWPNDIWQKKLGECLICKDNFSKGHKKIREFLSKYVIFEEEKTFDDCLGETGRNLPFDFYIPVFNLIIEFDGEQHFKPKWSEIEFQRTQKNDSIKNNYCNKKSIRLLRISYNQLNEVDTILEETFNDYRKGNQVE